MCHHSLGRVSTLICLAPLCACATLGSYIVDRKNSLLLKFLAWIVRASVAGDNLLNWAKFVCRWEQNRESLKVNLERRSVLRQHDSSLQLLWWEVVVGVWWKGTSLYILLSLEASRCFTCCLLSLVLLLRDKEGKGALMTTTAIAALSCPTTYKV